MAILAIYFCELNYTAVKYYVYKKQERKWKFGKCEKILVTFELDDCI